MKPEDILRETIINKETVSLPGLGVFLKKYIDAKYDSDSKQIIPPHYEIFFDKSSKSNDINFDQALFSYGFKTEQIADIIAKFIDDIKKLSHQEKLEISDIGYFTNINGEITFISNNSYSIDFNNFGFEPLKLNELKSSKKEDFKEQPKEQTNEKRIKQKAQNTNTNTTKNEIINNKQKIKINWIYVIFPIIILSIVSLIYFTNSYKFLTNLKFFKKDTKSNKTSIVIDSTKNKVKDEFILDEDIKKILNAKIKNTANVYLGQQYKKYYIVCNSFENVQNAENYAFQLRQKGYNTEIINGNKYYRVVIGSYDDVDLLIKEYNHFIEKLSKDIWILINKK